MYEKKPEKQKKERCSGYGKEAKREKAKQIKKRKSGKK